MSNIVFEDYSVRCKEALRDKAIEFLYDVGGLLRSMIQSASRRASSQTAGSYKYKVDEGQLVVHIGSDYQNAIWEEFGTGVHAIHGDGRKTPWRYKDANGQWHTTKGKKANRPMVKSYSASKGAIKARAEEIFRGLG